jgi:autoinducer 2-degrading protein
MYVTLVHVTVKPDCVAEFIAQTCENHDASVKEPGNRRFDVLQSAEVPYRFLLYEAYADAEAAASHKLTAHYLKWREKVKHMMEEPRKGIVWNALFPRD